MSSMVLGMRMTTSLNFFYDVILATRALPASPVTPGDESASQAGGLLASRAKHMEREGLGGAERDRTAGLVIANDALSQLSYSPKTRGV